jgi:hypothetical protein
LETVSANGVNRDLIPAAKSEVRKSKGENENGRQEDLGQEHRNKAGRWMAGKSVTNSLVPIRLSNHSSAFSKTLR